MSCLLHTFAIRPTGALSSLSRVTSLTRVTTLTFVTTLAVVAALGCLSAPALASRPRAVRPASRPAVVRPASQPAVVRPASQPAVVRSASQPAVVRPASQPAVVRSASLVQHGRSLRWEVKLRGVLSSKAMRRQHRSLCLLFERRRSKAVFSKLCVAPPRRSRVGARLLLSRVRETSMGATKDVGRAKEIHATVRRPGRSALDASFRAVAVGVGYRTLRWQVQSSVEPPACRPMGEGEEACSVRYPEKPRLLRLHAPKLVGCVPRGQSLVSSGPANEREIALTFDDGPWNDPPTIDFVNLLARYHVPATFFEIGDEISAFDPTGAIERRMLADGDMIGDHTWTHSDMVALPASQQRSQLQSTAAAIRDRTGFTPCLWRPPYGDTSGALESLARSLGFITVLWNIDPRDWSLPGVGAIEANVLSNARNGAIPVMHFGGGPRGQTLAALPKIITTLRGRGYKLVTVTKMLGLRLIYR